MRVMKSAFVVVLAVASMSSAVALACNESACPGESQRFDSKALRNAAKEAIALETSQKSLLQSRINSFELLARHFESLAEIYEATANNYFRLRARYFQRIRYDLGYYLEPLIRKGNELDEEMMSAYSVNNEIIEIARELVQRGRTNTSDIGAFTKYWDPRTQAALQDGLNGLSKKLGGNEEAERLLDKLGFEQIVQGVENDDMGRVMLGLPLDAEIEAREHVTKATSAKKRSRR